METNTFTSRPLHLKENNLQQLVNRPTSEHQDKCKLFRVKKNLLYVPDIE